MFSSKPWAKCRKALYYMEYNTSFWLDKINIWHDLLNKTFIFIYFRCRRQHKVLWHVTPRQYDGNITFDGYYLFHDIVSLDDRNPLLPWWGETWHRYTRGRCTELGCPHRKLYFTGKMELLLCRNPSSHHYHFCRDRNWEVQAGSPDKIFDKKMSICLTKL